MQINRRGKCAESTVILGDIKHVHPFQFLDGERTGLIFIKVYPCRSHESVESMLKEIQHDFHQFALVIDLEQGGIIAMPKNSPVVEIEYDFNVHGAQRRGH